MGTSGKLQWAARWATLDIDGSRLRDDLDMDLDQFVVEPKYGEPKRTGEMGTLIRISDLQSDWSLSRLTSLARAEFSKLQDPFETTGTLYESSQHQALSPG